MNNENKLLLEGELVLLVDHKDRRYLLTLETNSEFHSHSGFVSHNELIGKNDGSYGFAVRFNSMKEYGSLYLNLFLKLFYYY